MNSAAAWRSVDVPGRCRAVGSLEQGGGVWLRGVGELPNYIHVVPLCRDGLRQRSVRDRAKTREELLRTKGPSLRDRAVHLAQERGMVTTRELQAIGVHRCYLSPMCQEGLLVRVGHGLYRAAQSQDQAA